MASSLKCERKGFEIQAMNVPTPSLKGPQGQVVQSWVKITQGLCEI